MTSTSSVKVERDVVKDEEEEGTFPFDSTNLDDPLKDKITDPNGEMKAKEAFGDKDANKGRSHSKSSGNVKRLKVFITSEAKPNDGRQRRRKYATPEESRKAKAEWQRQRRANMKKEANLQERREWECVETLGTQPPGQSMTNPNRYEEYLKGRREYYKKRMEQIRNDPEKYEEKKRKMCEWHKKRKEQNPEKCEEQRRKDREYMANVKKKNPRQETEEEREKRKIKNKLHYKKNRERVLFAHFSRTQMQMAQMTDEELAAFKAKRTEYAKKWRESLTGEKLEKYRTYLRNNTKKYYHETRLRGNEEIANKDKIKARRRHSLANETPEQRQRRLRGFKINYAVKKLKKQLEKIETPPEEIEKRAVELRRTMEAEPLPPPETLSKYKPKVKSEVDFSFPPPSRPYGGRRRGRLPGSTRQTSNSNGEVSYGDQSKPEAGVGSTEMDNSDHFEDHGFQCDNDNHDPVPVLQFDIKCPHCPSTYSERSDLISHISSEHSEICWKCPKCKLIVLSSNELREHMNTSHCRISLGSTDQEKTFTCMKCEPTKSPHFECVKDLMTHVESTHPHSFWPCLKCNILKYTKCALKVHEKLCKFAGRTIKPNGQEMVMKK